MREASVSILIVALLSASGSAVQAQPLYKSFNSLEYLLGNASSVFIGTPHSVYRDDAKVVITFTAEETLKGEHSELPALRYKLGPQPEITQERVQQFEKFHKDERRCLVIALSEGHSVPRGENQIVDLHDDAKLHMVANNLKIVDNPNVLVKRTRKFCRAHPGALTTQGVQFVLPHKLAEKRFSYSQVIVMLPVVPSLETLAENYLESSEYSATSALRYFGRDGNGKRIKRR